MWYDNAGKYDKVVFRSSVEIRRNIKGYVFPCKFADVSEANEVAQNVAEAGRKAGFKLSVIGDMNDAVKDYFLKQAYIKSFDMEHPGTAVLTGDDENLFIRINTTDHFVVTGRCNGKNIRDLYVRADKAASAMETNLDISFSEKLGFLTSNTDYVGTGVSLTTLVSIPGIEKTTNGVDKLATRLSQYDWSIEPVSATRQDAPSMYVLSNTTTLGISEEEMIERAEAVIDDVIKFEMKCREVVYRKRKDAVEDQYYRAFASLAYARKMTTGEVISLVSSLRLGHDFIENNETGLTWETINKINNFMSNSFLGIVPITRGESLLALNDKDRADSIRKLIKEECQL